MNESFPTDRFSALHDGELTPVEGETLRAELNASEAARQEMADYDYISKLFAELPVDRLGDEFPSRVMQAIERRMLLPVAGELTARSSRKAAHRWWPAMSGLAVSAALLLTMVWYLDHRSGQQASLATRDPDEKMESAQPSVINGTEAATTEVADVHKKAMNESTDSAVAAPTSGVAGNFVAKDGDGVGLPSVTNSIEIPKADGIVDESKRFEFDKNLEEMHVGDVVNALDRTGERVSVVRLTVVDRRQGLEDLQVLLSKQSIPMNDDGTLAIAKSVPRADVAKSVETPLPLDRPHDAEKDSSPASAEDELVCVFVKADTKQLSAALWQLQHDGQLQELHVQDAPIEVADFDKLVGGEVVAKIEEFDAPVVAPHPAELSKLEIASKDADALGKSQFAKRAMKQSDLKPSDASVAESAPVNEQAASVNGRARSMRDLPQQQTRVQFPSRMLARQAQAEPNAAPNLALEQRQVSPNDFTRQFKQNQAPADRKLPEASQKASEATSDPVQVLLVLVQGQSRPAAAPLGAPTKTAE